MEKIGIIPIKYAESVFPENLIFENGDENKLRRITFTIYLLKSDNHKILVDAGCETMPGFDMRNFISPIRALENMNVSPAEITDVIITHSHHDHIECVKYFSNAKIYIQRSELKAGWSYIPSGFEVISFDNELSLSEEIKIVKIGGHSEGSCIVEVKGGEKIYVITGDECYSRESIQKRIPTGATVCPEKSRKFIDKYSSNKYEILLCHDD